MTTGMRTERGRPLESRSPECVGYQPQQRYVWRGRSCSEMRVGRIWRLWVIAVLWATTSAGFGRGAYAQQPPAAREEETFRFRFVGPRAGNRVAAVAGVPGDPSTYYAGAASGGVWKSTDGGNRWDPIFDKQPAAAIGAIAVSPSDPSVIWVGTGEA